MKRRIAQRPGSWSWSLPVMINMVNYSTVRGKREQSSVSQSFLCEMNREPACLLTWTQSALHTGSNSGEGEDKDCARPKFSQHIADFIWTVFVTVIHKPGPFTCIICNSLRLIQLWCECNDTFLPVPLQASVIVPVEKVRLGSSRSHIWMNSYELQHSSGPSLLHANDDGIR